MKNLITIRVDPGMLAHICVFLAFGRQREEDEDLKVILRYTVVSKPACEWQESLS